MHRRELIVKKVEINGIGIRRIIVDGHVSKHRDITDSLIFNLVSLLDGVEQYPEAVKMPYEYFATLLLLAKKQYRVVWLLEIGKHYIGIITIYRDRRSN